MHTTNFIIIYFELFLSNIPLKNYHHALFSMILPFIYCLFEWILNICCSIPFAYPFVDPGVITNSLFYVGIFGMHLLCWTIAYKFKNVIIEKCIRKNLNKSNKNMEQLNDDIMMDENETNEMHTRDSEISPAGLSTVASINSEYNTSLVSLETDSNL